MSTSLSCDCIWPKHEVPMMSGVDTQLIEELLQEQNLDSEDVFCSEGGCFQVIDVRGGKLPKPDIFISRLSNSMRLTNATQVGSNISRLTTRSNFKNF